MMMKRAPRWRFQDVRFVLICVLFAVLAHAAGYLIHEYAHSIVAWALGWMPTPFGIDYGKPTPSNLLFLGDVSDDVDYAPIFASGHGAAAASIALAGTFLGNGAGYVIAAVAFSRLRGRRWWALAWFWFGLMCAANVWSYVPLRTLSNHADMALTARGLGISGGVLLLGLLLPVGLILWHFFVRLFPVACVVATGGSTTCRAVLIAMGAFWFFSFFVGDEMDGAYGVVAQVLALSSRYVLFPLAVALLADAALMRQGTPLQGDLQGHAACVG